MIIINYKTKKMKKIIILSVFALLGITHALAQHYEPLFIVREGVKWVNERVVINNGDTTYSYYTYEIQGEAPECYSCSHGHSMSCHYYTGSQIDYENDSLICALAQDDWFGVIVYCFGNEAYNKVTLENRNMFHRMNTPGIGTGELLYLLYQPLIVNIGEYLSLQIEPIMNEDNFIEVEPIEIEGVTCHRIAYINEQNDTLAYIVEGIGFDSRDMGDLLTPFTRKPDPDADYQEYWGLSHVIKDGKIIYKGMRYNLNNVTGVDELAVDKARQADGNYYNLMGQPMGKQLPTTPGIYIHHGKKIIVK